MLYNHPVSISEFFAQPCADSTRRLFIFSRISKPTAIRWLSDKETTTMLHHLYRSATLPDPMPSGLFKQLIWHPAAKFRPKALSTNPLNSLILLDLEVITFQLCSKLHRVTIGYDLTVYSTKKHPDSRSTRCAAAPGERAGEWNPAHPARSTTPRSTT
jgi:hypothetical protein